MNSMNKLDFLTPQDLYYLVYNNNDTDVALEKKCVSSLKRDRWLECQKFPNCVV